MPPTTKSGLDPLLEDYLYYQQFGLWPYAKRIVRQEWRTAIIVGICSGILGLLVS